MRKVVSWLLLFVGALLLATAFLTKFWAPDVAKRTPLDTDSETHLTGTANYVTRASGPTDNVAVKASSFNATDSKASSDDVAVFRAYTCLVTEESETPCGRPGEGDDADPNVLNISAMDYFATDRRTAEAVDQSKFDFAGESVQHEGLVNKFPFDVEKKDYDFWDGMLDRAVTAEYVGTKDIDGLETYEFNYKVEDEPAEVSADLQGLYSMDKTMYVDPTTGSIVDQEQHEIRTNEDGDTLLDLELSFTDDQVKSNVDDAEANASKLNTITGTVPLIGFILGPILLIAGGVLLFRGAGDSGGSRKADTTASTE